MIFNQYFYHPDLSQTVVTLSAEESEHCVRALRHRAGDQVLLTDGRGSVATAVIIADNPKACMVELTEVRDANDKGKFRLHLAVAPTKNADRIEWLVEKCVEVGVESVSFIICEHSERKRVNLDRLNRIAISALKQCQTSWLPPMEEIVFEDFVRKFQGQEADKYIAWCDDENTRQLADEVFKHEDIVLLIGPEGDFSPAEIQMAREYNYLEIKLGHRRLRTETAGLYGCMAVAFKSQII